jgi:hypothetical protein
MERAIPVQRRYNALRNRKAEYLNRCAIGQWLREKDSMDDPKQLELEGGFPGQIFDYSKGFRPPEMVQNPPLPAAFETEEQTLLTEFSILFGVSEISRQSAVPAGVKSGVAIDLLKEQDDTRLSNVADNIERHNIQSGKIQLRMAKQFVKGPQTLRIVGKNNISEVIDWQGSDISSEDVYLENVGIESPAQKRQMVFDLLQSGLINDPDTGKLDKDMRAKVFEMIQMNEWELADDPENLHIAKAERENKMLEKGLMPEPVVYDDHFIHIARHNSFRLTVEYEELAARMPQIGQVFEVHVNMHLMYLAQTAQMQAQQQMAAQMAQ